METSPFDATEENMTEETQRPRLMAVLAHPDDESFGMGGTLALYASRGVEVTLVCATRGEAGQVDPQYLEGFDSIAARREDELRCAATHLGLAKVHFIEYRDSGMPGSPDNDHPEALVNAPLEETAAQVACYIRTHKPDVVLTFDPYGGYMHPDHIAIHHATVRAFELAASKERLDLGTPHQAAKLYYHIIPRGFLKLAVPLLRLFGRNPAAYGRNGDINLVELMEKGSFPIHARIDTRPVQAESEAATACHASQLSGGAPVRGPIAWIMRLTRQRDTFMRAYPPAPEGLRVTDLFADE
jgi:LmbE family N-acetylglucosaminyl deacetylase